ncbi:hypothetical protein KC356_g8187 [Hortaea werneckii]|nr:hypothetical protein KC356_g8187 [Hortaea werneckii]
MQVQPGYYQHAHPPPQQSNDLHANGLHPPDAAQQFAPGYTNGQITAGSEAIGSENMHPYHQQPYQSTGYGYQQQHQPPSQHQHQPQTQHHPQQQRFPPTLPPMQTSMGAHAPPPPPFSGPVPGANVGAYAPMSAQQHQSQQPQMYGPGPGMQSQLPQQAMSAAGPSSYPQERQMSKSGSKGNYQFALEICQQPQRARMCGFGDKDRRPITPPPCIRLRITDSRTGKEVDIGEFEGNFFVLQVDLWDEKGEKEVNIVRASSSSPAVSISTATTTSYPPPPERPMISEMSPPGMYIGPDGQPYMAQNLRHPSYPGGPMGYPNQFGQQAYPGAPMPYMPQSQNNSAMFTRNLIGSLTVNASKLEDPEKKPGFWFVLQDLSVRTEGFFRLKMNFIDVGDGALLNKGRAPVLAWTFSDKFQVYSAKKFPGVIESTPLSKCFAAQGIKIPIRKDTKEKDEDED